MGLDLNSSLLKSLDPRNPHRQAAVYRERFAGDVIVLGQQYNGMATVRGCFTMQGDALFEIYFLLLRAMAA